MPKPRLFFLIVKPIIINDVYWKNVTYISQAHCCTFAKSLLVVTSRSKSSLNLCVNLNHKYCLNGSLNGEFVVMSSFSRVVWMALSWNWVRQEPRVILLPYQRYSRLGDGRRSRSCAGRGIRETIKRPVYVWKGGHTADMGIYSSLK